MTNTTISKTIFLNASRDTVWSFLTEAEKLALWFHPARSDLVEGEDYALLGKSDDGAEQELCWGKVIKMEAPESMVWSFTVGPLSGAMTTVTWTLQPAGDGTQLTLVHEGISEAAGEAALGLLMALDAGWDEHFAKLRSSVSASSAGSDAAAT